MLVELTVIPMGPDTHSADVIARCVDYLEDTGLPFVLSPTGTCVEGDWDDVMPAIKRCHEIARAASPHVTTLIKIEDEEGVRDKMASNVASVREKRGHAH